MSDEPMTSDALTSANRPAVSVVGPGDGETIVLGTTRLRVLEDGSNTGHRLGLAESILAPHTPGPAQHRHARHARHEANIRVISRYAAVPVAEPVTDLAGGGKA